jgi:hypothetical protein
LSTKIKKWKENFQTYFVMTPCWAKQRVEQWWTQEETSTLSWKVQSFWPNYKMSFFSKCLNCNTKLFHTSFRKKLSNRVLPSLLMLDWCYVCLRLTLFVFLSFSTSFGFLGFTRERVRPQQDNNVLGAAGVNPINVIDVIK